MDDGTDLDDHEIDPVEEVAMYLSSYSARDGDNAIASQDECDTDIKVSEKEPQ